MSEIKTRPIRNVGEAVIANPNNKDAEQRLLEFVEKQIDKMKKYAKFNAVDGQPGFFELNRALAEHQVIWLGLVALNVVAKDEHAKAKRRFDEWFSQKYIEKRDELNPRSLASTKWYSTKEIEMAVRVDNKAEYAELDIDLTCAERKVSAIRRLMEGWQSQQFILARLSKNVEAEYGSGLLEDRII